MASTSLFSYACSHVYVASMALQSPRCRESQHNLRERFSKIRSRNDTTRPHTRRSRERAVGAHIYCALDALNVCVFVCGMICGWWGAALEAEYVELCYVVVGLYRWMEVEYVVGVGVCSGF